MEILVICMHLDYCSLETFSATCSSNEAISMVSATYGLMRIGRCMDDDFGHLGCHSEQLAYLDQLCSGRQTCQLANSNNMEMQESTPCPSGLRSYLEASYTCETGNDRKLIFPLYFNDLCIHTYILHI